ncbi:citryl-CoA lyase, partial [Bacillus wiedmannii]|uniref:citryl-CoA lyase n=1 Tax=Bacillus wiedmannii TaxID=1890302 RepID=UPI0034644318
MGRRPSAKESVIFNAVLVTLVEHGLTPMAIVSRLTYLGAPESLQGAVAAGLCGMGTTFAGTAEGAARMLHEGVSEAVDADLREVACRIVAAFKTRKAAVPGIGHHLHRPVDPRTSRLFEIAEEQGYRGRYVALMEEVSLEAERVYGKPLPVNATGAIGALCCEMSIPWQIARGISVMGRAVGLVGHLVEEQVEPIAAEIWLRAEEEASAEPMP